MMLIFSLVGVWAYHYWEINELASNWLKSRIGDEWHKQLTFSKYFIADYLLGILIFINFASVRALGNSIAPFILQIERPIRFLAGYTLTLYLLHQPLFLFWAAVIRGNPDSWTYWWTTTALVAVSVYAIGYITENKRHLLKLWVEQRLSACEQFAVGKWYAINR
jgi:peptidoglycan/LPS O-acetylase OafA/YrhL